MEANVLSVLTYERLDQGAALPPRLFGVVHVSPGLPERLLVSQAPGQSQRVALVGRLALVQRPSQLLRGPLMLGRGVGQS